MTEAFGSIMGVHSASACILLLASLGLGCGSEFTEASLEGGSPHDGAPGDTREPDVSSPDTGGQDGVTPGEAGPGTFPCGSFKMTKDCEAHTQFCTTGVAGGVPECVATPSNCLGKLAKDCNCDRLFAQSMGFSCTCTGAAGSGEYTVECKPLGKEAGAPEGSVGKPDGSAGDATSPRDGGLGDVRLVDVRLVDVKFTTDL
jgi:hypothetical protein